MSEQQRPKFLAMLAEQDRVAEAPRRVEMALRDRVRSKQKPEAAVVAAGWFRWRAFWAGAAMAAAVGLAVAAWMRPQQQSVAPVTEQARAMVPATEPKTIAPVAVQGTEETAPAASVEKLMSAAKPRVRKPAPVVREQEPRSFYSISYASPELLANAQIVRVRIPSSALMQFGLPMSAYRSSGGQVEADVIYTEDGVARAIRFVPQQEFRKE